VVRKKEPKWATDVHFATKGRFSPTYPDSSRYDPSIFWSYYHCCLLCLVEHHGRVFSNPNFNYRLGPFQRANSTTLSTPPSPSSLRPLLGLHLKLLVVLRPTTVPMTWKPQVRGGGGTDSRRIYRCFSGIYWWSRTKISSPRRYMYFIIHRAT